MSTPAEPRKRHVVLRVLITLALVVFVVIVLVFLLSQPVSAPGQTETTSEATIDSTTETNAPAFEYLFMSDRDGDWDIYAASGDTVTNLTNNDYADGFASYSTDGEQISFVSRRDGGELGGYLMNADGSNQVQATTDVGTFVNILLNGRGDWDRRGENGAATIISLRDLNLEVYFASREAQTNLTNNGAIDWYAQLAPDGERIAFASDRVDGQHDIYVMGIDGDNLRRLTDHPADDWSPLWIDDNRIVFASERDIGFEGAALGLYVIDVTEAGSGIPPAQNAEGMTMRGGYVMNADGTHWLEMFNETGDWEINVTARDATRVNLTNNPANDLFPVWK